MNRSKKKSQLGESDILFLSPKGTFWRGKDIYVWISKSGHSSIFPAKVKDLLINKSIENFPKRDMVRIYSLFFSDGEFNHSLSQKPKRSDKSICFLVFISLLFLGLILSSSMVDGEHVQFNVFGFKYMRTAAIWWPIVYIFSAIVTEIYGYSVNRLTILSIALVSLIIYLLSIIPIFLPVISGYENRQTPNFHLINLISVFSFIFSDFCNSFIVSKMKIWKNGNFPLVRFLTGCLFAIFIDTFCFNIVKNLLIEQYFSCNRSDPCQ